MTPIDRVAKAIAEAEAEWWRMIEANHGSGRGVPDQGHMHAVAALAALSADGPVIVVDGRAVELEKVAEAYMVDLWSDHATEWAEHVADLAREVAE